MEVIDRIYTARPIYGSRKMTVRLQELGYQVNRKRIQRLMRLMGLEAFYPKPNLSKPCTDHKKYPYLLRGVVIVAVNQAWGTDITYIPLKGGFLYLVAIIEWRTRLVLSWRLSNTLDTGFCIEALVEALNKYGEPEIFNTDQGVQFTSKEFIKVLEDRKIKISMDGKGRWADNVLSERLWRSVKYEDIYINRYETGAQVANGLKDYFLFYNNERPHQSLNYRTPQAAYTNEILKLKTKGLDTAPPAALREPSGGFTLLTTGESSLETQLSNERQVVMSNY